MSMDGYFKAAYGISFPKTRENLELLAGRSLDEFCDGDFFDSDEAAYSLDFGADLTVEPYVSEGIDDEDSPVMVYLTESLVSSDRFSVDENLTVPSSFPKISRKDREKLIELKERIGDDKILGPEYLFWVYIL